MKRALSAIVLAAVLAAPARAQEVVVIDRFDDVAAWSPHPASGVELSLHADQGAMRLDFDFQKGGGYAIARRAVSLDLPANYAFTFRLRGAAPVNHLEFKLIDASDENVWWHVNRDVAWPAEWTPVRIKKRQIGFAWGPLGGGEIQHVAAIEIVVTAGTGGRGTVWIDDLELRPLPPADAQQAVASATASSSVTGGEPNLAVDDRPQTAWRSGPGDRTPWLALDFQAPREFGGVLLEWAPGLHAVDYDVEASDDGSTWRLLRAVRGSDGGRDAIFTPDQEARHVRVRVIRPAARTVALMDVSFGPVSWESRADFFKGLAALHPESFPPSMRARQTYWTVVGVDGGEEDALMGEDGAIEAGMASFSIEPFLMADRRLLDEGVSSNGLVGGYMPMPWTRRTFYEVKPRSSSAGWNPCATGLPSMPMIHSLDLSVSAFGIGSAESSFVVVRYHVQNRLGRRDRVTLVLAIRPFQVNPISQFLNTAGGPARVQSISFRGSRAIVNGNREIVSLQSPSGAAASSFDGGEIVEHLARGVLPRAREARDDFEAASGAFLYHFDLGPGAEREVVLLIPLAGDRRADPRLLPSPRAAKDWADARQHEEEWHWHNRLERVSISIPDTSIMQTLRAQLGWILVDRAGPALQPGTRAYARSWIRDGALTSTALLRLGRVDVVRDFIDWFAPYQYDDGKVPCCVDKRGADPVPEHDSGGEFIYLVAEYFRHTGDRDLAGPMWPRVRAAAGYLDSLRQTRRTAEWRAPAKIEFFGLLPPSISHEGYSAKPMHSYWDDFFALRGFRDAAFLAGELGHVDEKRRLTRVSEEFARELGASIRAAMRRHKIDYIPGSADLGDFDATSTTIALSPVGAESVVPPGSLRRTFDKWLDFHHDRVAKNDWDAFTPYELRIVGSLVRLGRREEALDVLRWLMKYQRPAGWLQWAEVVGREGRKQRFLGDMPHGWVASDGIRSILDMLAYERESDDALVIGAGIPREWLRQRNGVEVQNLSTRHGRLGYGMLETDGAVVQVAIGGRLTVPRAGIVVAPPGDFRSATVNGKPTTLEKDGTLIVREVPAHIELRR